MKIKSFRPVNMKRSLFFCFVIFFVTIFSAQVFSGEKTSLRFFTKTMMKDIDGTNSNAKCLINFTDGAVVVEALTSQFIFSSSTMQDHYNEKYIESKKFPTATFKGKIKEKIDCSKNETHAVTVSGTLTLHGVEKACEMPGTIIVKDGKITADSKFTLVFADYAVKPPTMIGKKLAEKIEITFHSEMIPFVKK